MEQFKDVRKEDFVEKYTSLVQRLSLLLLQVTLRQLRDSLAVELLCSLRPLASPHQGVELNIASQLQQVPNALLGAEWLQVFPDHALHCLLCS